MYIYAVPVLYAGVQMLELTAVLARISGIISERRLLGYSLQQSVYMCTRFLLVLLLPILGYMVDKSIPTGRYQLVAHSSLALSTAFGVVVFMKRVTIIEYYLRIIDSYSAGKSFISAFLLSFRTSGRRYTADARAPLPEIIASVEGRKVLFGATAVFSIYSVGIFVSFYAALVFHEHRAAISQLSGIINAAGAVLLTFFVEPLVAKRIDEFDVISRHLVMGMFWGRLISLAVVGQIILCFTFYT